MRKYERYLLQNAEETNQVHHSVQLICSPVENVILKTTYASSELVSNDVFKCLQEIPNYQPVFLNDFAPKDRYKVKKMAQ